MAAPNTAHARIAPRQPPEHVRARPVAPAAGPPPVRGAAAWTRAVRIRQWPKNLLVFGAPAAGGVLLRHGVLGRVSVVALSFCLLSAGAYLLNDLRDAPEDRRHPVKRHRPIASRAITPGRALAAAVMLTLGGLVLAGSLGARSLAVAAAYAALNFAYTGWLRRVAIADLAAIAGAFMLRATAGGVAAGVPISRWFFVVVLFAALFVAAGKRYSDYLDPAARRSRAVLRDYNPEFLQMVIAVACAVALGAYCLWALQGLGREALGWREATILPFTIALLRYALLVTSGRGGAPEEVLLGDRFMQVTVLAWLLTFVLAI